MADDQGSIAWDYILQQHKADRNAEAFVRAFYAPMTGLANAIDQLSLALVLDGAEGERLDLIGSIVGQERGVAEGIAIPYFGFEGYPGTLGFGKGRFKKNGDPSATTYTLPDVEYRRLIRAKIFLNNARGTGPEIEAAGCIAFDVPTCSLIDSGNATAELRVGRIIPSTDPLFRAVPKLLGRLGGVRINITFEDADTPFGFAGYPGTYGFGVGKLSIKGGAQ